MSLPAILDLLPPTLAWGHCQHLASDGVDQMALDEALLFWLAKQSPTLITRCYTWVPHTLSVGKNQSAQSIQQAREALCPSLRTPIVRRPTGGRAILHGQDVSFAFVTNIPALRALSLKDSYCVFAKWVRSAIVSCQVPLADACTPNPSDYTRSALCFETHAVGDLIRPDGSKVAGAAQWRNAYGLLQHGAAFLDHQAVQPHTFEDALLETMKTDLRRGPQTLDLASAGGLEALWHQAKSRRTIEMGSFLQAGL